MTINWKIWAALVVMVGAVILTANGVRSSTYSGAQLNFDVGSGPITLNNTSDSAVEVQFVGSGSRSFNVTSTVESVSGASTRTGSGSAAIQTFAFTLPAGTNEFTIVRGANVRFMVDGSAQLEATMQPLSADQTRNSIIATLVLCAGLAFYMSYTMQHRWLLRLLGRSSPALVTAAASQPQVGQGRTLKGYGDNRSSK